MSVLEFESDAPMPPESCSGEVLALWFEVLDSLRSGGVHLLPVDGMAIQGFCVAVCRLRELRRLGVVDESRSRSTELVRSFGEELQMRPEVLATYIGEELDVKNKESAVKLIRETLELAFQKEYRDTQVREFASVANEFLSIALNPDKALIEEGNERQLLFSLAIINRDTETGVNLWKAIKTLAFREDK